MPHWVSASGPGRAALAYPPGSPAPALPTQAAPGVSPPQPSRLCWQALVTRCPLCGLGGGGAPVLLLAAESQLPAGLWGQRVAGDRPGGMEPKTLEMASGNPCLALVGKLRLSEGKGCLMLSWGQTSGQDTSLVGLQAHGLVMWSSQCPAFPQNGLGVCLSLCAHTQVHMRVSGCS